MFMFDLIDSGERPFLPMNIMNERGEEWEWE